MNKNLTLIFNHFEKEHLGKDVFLVPQAIGKRYGYDVTIVYPQTPTNSTFPSEIRGIKLRPIKANRRLKWFPIWRTLPFYLYLIRHATKIDLLMRFHYVDHTYYHIILYKFLNRKGKVYLKCDGFNNTFRKALGHRSWSSRKMKHMLDSIIKKVDRFSIETSNDYNYIINCGNETLNAKLRLMPNGFDEEELERLHIKQRNYSEKENLMITVGRLGTYPKNTEMILEALDGVNLKNWKVELVGPINADLKPKIVDFYNRNPDKQN